MTQSDDVAATAPAAVARARLSAVMRNDYCRGRTADVGAQVGPFAMAHPVLSTCLTSRPMRQPRVRQIRSLFLSPSLVPWFGSLARVPVPCVQRPLNRTSSSVLLQILALCFVASLCPKASRAALRVPCARAPTTPARKDVCAIADAGWQRRRRRARREGKVGGEESAAAVGLWAKGTHSIPEGTQQPAQKKVEKPGSRGRRMCCHEPNAR